MEPVSSWGSTCHKVQSHVLASNGRLFLVPVLDNAMVDFTGRSVNDLFLNSMFFFEEILIHHLGVFGDTVNHNETDTVRGFRGWLGRISIASTVGTWGSYTKIPPVPYRGLRMSPCTHQHLDSTKACHCGPVHCRDTVGRYGAIMAPLRASIGPIFLASGYYHCRPYGKTNEIIIQSETKYPDLNLWFPSQKNVAYQRYMWWPFVNERVEKQSPLLGRSAYFRLKLSPER